MQESLAAFGRNGGQVIPGLKYDPDQLIERFGAARGEKIIEACGGAADEVFSLVQSTASPAMQHARAGFNPRTPVPR